MEGENEHVKVKMGGEKGAAGQTKKRGESKKSGGPNMDKLGKHGCDLGGLKATERGVGDTRERSETSRGIVGAQTPAWIKPTHIQREGLGGKEHGTLRLR